MDSVANIVTCLERTVAELELDAPPRQSIRDTIGLALGETLGMLFPQADEGLRRRILDRYRQHWFTTYRDECVLFDGAREALQDVSQAGYLLAVATGKSRRGLDRDLERTGLGPLFHATRTADEAPSKPHPRMLQDLLEELALSPRESLMIGDTTHDLEMARHAGVAAVGVTSGSHPRAWLEPLEPLACLESVADLPRWLREAWG